MTTPATEPSHRFDFFEPGDRTALICLDLPELQRAVVEQVDKIGYKIHTGLFLDDCMLKLYSHVYDVVIFSDHFAGQELWNHAILKESAHSNPTNRRKQVYILLGETVTTNDELEAFSLSVDMVVNVRDVAALRPMLRRAASRQTEFYAVYADAQARLAATDSSGIGLR